MAMPDLRRSVAPVDYPVSLEQAKAHLRVDNPDSDMYIESLIETAALHIDGKDGLLFRCLMPQTWLMCMDGFPACGEIVMPLGPVVLITSITYIDSAGTLQTVPAGDYDVALADGLDSAIVRPGYGKSWPAARFQARAVTITYDAGYPSAAAVPAPIRHAILLMVGHWYANRESVITGVPAAQLPMAVEALLYPYQRLMV